MKRRLQNLRPEALRAAAAGWFRQRLDLGPLWALMAKKTVPVHRHGWIYLTGGAALFLLGLQVAGGCLLMLYYQPTEAAAHQSVERIMTEVPSGWLVRGVHVWGGHLFIAAVVVHFLAVLFSRAYRRPRELTWVAGVLLLGLALASGFTGYLLPWNELSYNATLVGTQIPGSLPGVGDFLVHLLRGGDQVTGQTITRFYAAHVMILPLGFALLLAVHLALVQLQGMSLPLGMTDRQVTDRRPFFSEFLLIDAGVWLVLSGAVVTLAVLLPAELGVRADPLKPAPAGIRPEWYFLFMFQTLKVLPAFLFGGQTPAGPLDVPGELLAVGWFALLGVFLLVLPFLDRGAARERKSPLFSGLFVVLLAYVLALEIWAIAQGGAEAAHEVPAAQTSVTAGRIVWLVLLWSVIGWMVFYLRRLLQQNTRVRKLYGGD